MNVLFLGGPWHDERHDVTPTRVSSAGCTLPAVFHVAVAAGSRRHVTYRRRFARCGEERLPVYVTADYQGPPRA